MLYSPSTGGFYSPEIHAQIPDDAIDITHEEHRALLAGQSAGHCIVPDAQGRPCLAERPAPTPEQIEATICAAVQQRLDDYARSLGYDHLLAACSYATSTNPTWQHEAAACIALRDATWTALFSLLASTPAPTDYAQVEPALPPLPPTSGVLSP